MMAKYVSYKNAEIRRETMFCVGAILLCLTVPALPIALIFASAHYVIVISIAIAFAAVCIGLMIPAIRRDGAAHWMPRPFRDFTLAIMDFCRYGQW